MIQKDSKGRLLHCLSSDNDNNLALTKMLCEYTQEPDTNADSDCPNSMIIETHPEGYITISTERFAFDNKDEVIKLIDDFLSRVEFEKF